MPPIRLQFAQSSNRGRLGVDNPATVLNAYSEPLGEGGKNDFALYAAPGLRPWLKTGSTGYRGSLVVNGFLFVVMGQKLYSVSLTGSIKAIGKVDGVAPVRFARNALATPDVMLVSGGLVWYLKGDQLTRYQSDVLPPPVDVCYIRGRFVFPTSDGRFFYSDINSTTIGGASFYNPEGNADGLIGCWARRGELWLIGGQSLQIWSPTTNIDDPFARQGGGARPYGAVSSASITELMDQIFWVDHENNVRVAQGYEPVDISPPFVKRLIKAEPDKSGIICFGYDIAGQHFLSVTGSSFSLCYSIETKKWTERQTHQHTRWRAQGAVSFNGQVIVGDYATGDLYQMDADYDMDGDEPIVMRLVAPIVHAWPLPLTIYSLHVDIVPGVGKNTGARVIDDPQALLRLSEDGGESWFGPVMEPLGQIGSRPRIIFRQLGTFDRMGATVELTLPASVVRSVRSAIINGAPGTA